jgi:hypothetical protein
LSSGLFFDGTIAREVTEVVVEESVVVKFLRTVTLTPTFYTLISTSSNIHTSTCTSPTLIALHSMMIHPPAVPRG